MRISPRKCPVCKATIFGAPERCNYCGTPLRFAAEKSPAGKAVFLSALFPGAAHLWYGRLITGSIAFFGSILSVCIFISSFYRSELSTLSYFTWAGFWLLWLTTWTLQFSFLQSRKVTALELGIYFLVLLLFINIFVFVYWLSILAIIW